ncbi:MAG: cell division protein FtsK [Deltaproteobacteria bacterium]|nr:MAG: cell division protein FtsK [Deltaproteobacteria bacterium]
MGAKDTKAARPETKQEVLAVIGIFIALFLFLSLLADTFHFDANLTGKVGSFIARALFSFIGWGGYLLPTLLLVASFFLFTGGLRIRHLPRVVAGLTGAILSFCGFLSSLSIHDPSLLDSGGFLGVMEFRVLDSVVGHGGAVLVFVMVFLISLMLSAQFSPYLLFAGMLRGIKSLLTPRLKSRQSPVRPATPEPEKTVIEQAVESGPIPIVKNPVRTGGGEVDEEFAAIPLARGDWKLPPLSLLEEGEHDQESVSEEVYYRLSQKLEQKLKNFGVSGRVVGISPGPVVTTYEYSPAPGVKINRISGLSDDLALGLKVGSVRVAGSIPGKAALGIEIPNEHRQLVPVRDLIGSEEYRRQSERQKLTMALGLDVAGNLVMANLAKMPHLLIAGATGAGKSVGINTLITSILYNATPEEVRLLMVDPKRIELSGYEGIPHLLHPVVVEPKLASRALNWAVREMERRYRLLEEAKVKSFDSYNEQGEERLPYIVVVVDELADLMMVASKDVEASIARLAQMARAAGMHVILATQRPSVDVLTGLIKANFPTRISFKVSSKVDSRTILDTGGAEHLLGMGDMLYLPNGGSLCRVHGAYISEKETEGVVDFWKAQGSSSYDAAMIEEIEKEERLDMEGDNGEHDDLYDQAVAFVSEQGQASISSVQRKFRVGYNRAARMIEIMEREGIIGPADGAKPRKVIVRRDYNNA